MKVLILGAKGSLGQTFAGMYEGEEVFAWDREELDITDEQATGNRIQELKPNLVINCAAYNAVDKAEEDRETAELLDISSKTVENQMTIALRKLGEALQSYLPKTSLN